MYVCKEAGLEVFAIQPWANLQMIMQARLAFQKAAPIRVRARHFSGISRALESTAALEGPVSGLNR